MSACTVCGGTELEADGSRGDVTCVTCGTVQKENSIVMAVTFSEQSGSTSVVGQFVSTTGFQGLSASAKGSSVQGARSHVTRMRESREQTIAQGNRQIAQLATQFTLRQHHTESAQRLFRLAVQRNFVQGRRTRHVIAACLYIVCRIERTPHLLIDFSERLQVNLHTLGRTFLKFVRLLNLSLPVIDPSLFIHRFASKLEFGDKAHAVAMSALRLVARMRKDWIHTGRRPSGICGACLLIAARVHGFRRSQREIVRVVRICDVTLRKRLNEFAETPASRLSFEQLAQQDSAVECDPPAFRPDEETTPALPAASNSDDAAIASVRAAMHSDEFRTLERDVAEAEAKAEQEARLRQVRQLTTVSSRKHASEDEDEDEEDEDEDELESQDDVESRGDKERREEESAIIEIEGSLSDLDDDEELNGMLLSKSESQWKERMWKEINANWLRRQRQKQRQLELDAKKLGTTPEAAAAMRRARARKRRDRVSAAAPTSASEAVAQAIGHKQSSLRVNRDALTRLQNLMASDTASDVAARDHLSVFGDVTVPLHTHVSVKRELGTPVPGTVVKSEGIQQRLQAMQQSTSTKTSKSTEASPDTKTVKKERARSPDRRDHSPSSNSVNDEDNSDNEEDALGALARARGALFGLHNSDSKKKMKKNKHKKSKADKEKLKKLHKRRKDKKNSRAKRERSRDRSRVKSSH
ncbi:MAG: hypothetical protein MHM6MM_001964 [Cercozoa sp. M6MM]